MEDKDLGMEGTHMRDTRPVGPTLINSKGTIVITCPPTSLEGIEIMYR